MASRCGNSGRFYFLGLQNLADGDCSHEIKGCLLLGRKARQTLLTKVHIIKTMVFTVVMYGCWDLDHFEGWAPKNWWFWTVVLEKTVESPFGCKEIKPVHSYRKSVLNIHWKDWCWEWSSNTLSTWCKELTHWKRSWCWERLKAKGEGDSREWDH